MSVLESKQDHHGQANDSMENADRPLDAAEAQDEFDTPLRLCQTGNDLDHIEI